MTTETAIEAILNGENFFTCVLKGGCRMEKAACVIRRRNALTGWVAGSSSAPNKPGAQDTGCRDCAQGKQIEKEVSHGAVKAYQMRVGGHRKWDRKAMAKPGQIIEPSPEPAGKVCSRKECKHEGRPQSPDNFHKGSRKDGLCGYCKDCQRDLSEERKAKLAGLKKSLRERLDKAKDLNGQYGPMVTSEQPGPPTKVCPDPACEMKGESQPLDNFYANKGTPDGKSYHCKPCMRRRQKEYDQKRRVPKEGQVIEQPATDDKPITLTKRCNTCGTVKPVKDFSPSNTSKDGYMHICRSCFRGRQESGLHRENDVTLLKLNFEGHADLLAELSRVAAAEFRTVQAQAMVFIQRALARN